MEGRRVSPRRKSMPAFMLEGKNKENSSPNEDMTLPLSRPSRQSLIPGRGILKATQDDNMTITGVFNLQPPVDQTLAMKRKKSLARRVSFAPEAAVRRFDPERESSSPAREPARRKSALKRPSFAPSPNSKLMSPTKSSQQKASPKKSPKPASPKTTPVKKVAQLASPSPASRTRSKSPVVEEDAADDDESEMSMEISDTPRQQPDANQEEMLISFDSPPKQQPVRQLYPELEPEEQRTNEARLSFPSIFKTKPQTKIDAEEGKEDDEGEMSMDMTGVNKVPAQGGEGEEESDGEVSMDITRQMGGIQDDETDMSMDVTRSIGGIQPANDHENDDDDMDETRAIGNIRGVDDGNEEDEDDMDETRAIGNIRVDANPNEDGDEDEDDMDMEETRAIGNIRPAPIQEAEEEEEEDEEEDEMEMTRAVGNIALQDDNEEEEMEVTQALGRIQPAKRAASPQRTTPSKRHRPSTPEKQKIPNLQHPSLHKDQTPSQQLKESIMSLTPRRSARRTPREMHSPPRQQQQFDLVSHTPLNTMKNMPVPGPTPSPMKKNLLQNLEEYGEYEEVDDEYENVRLSDFLSTINIDFMDDFLTSTRGHSSFGLTNDSVAEPKLVDYVVAGQRIAVFGVFDFSIREMRNNVKTAKELFEQFEEDTLDENPQLFREYLEANPNTKQIMNSQFKLMKTYAREQAKNVWYTWRATLIQNVHKVLEKNLKNVQDDQKLLDGEKSAIEREYEDVQSKHSEIKRKLDAMRKRQTELESCDRDTIVNAQNSLAQSKKELNNSKEELDKQSQKGRATRESIEELLQKKRSLHEQIQAAEKIQEQHRQIEQKEIVELRQKFAELQLACGVSNTTLDGLSIVFNVDSELQLAANLETRAITAKILSTDDTLLFFHAELVKNLDQLAIPQQLETIKQRWGRAKQIARDLRVLRLKHMTKLKVNPDSNQLVLKLRLHLPNSKVVIKVQINSATLESYPTISGQVSMSNMYGDECSLEETCKKLEARLSSQGVPGVAEECSVLIS